MNSPGDFDPLNAKPALDKKTWTAPEIRKAWMVPEIRDQSVKSLTGAPKAGAPSESNPTTGPS